MGEKLWFSEGEPQFGQCGPDHLLPHNNEPAQCNPNDKKKNVCCSKHGWCGNTWNHCFCDGCLNYNIETLNAANGSVCSSTCGVGFKYGQLILHRNWCYTHEFDVDGTKWTWDWCENKSGRSTANDNGENAGKMDEAAQAYTSFFSLIDPSKHNMTLTSEEAAQAHMSIFSLIDPSKLNMTFTSEDEAAQAHMSILSLIDQSKHNMTLTSEDDI